MKCFNWWMLKFYCVNVLIDESEDLIDEKYSWNMF